MIVAPEGPTGTAVRTPDPHGPANYRLLGSRLALGGTLSLPAQPTAAVGVRWVGPGRGIRMVAETAQHAGHADIIREQIDGRLGDDEASVDADAVFWRDRRSRVQEAADHYRVL